MTHLEEVTQHLDALKIAAAPDIPVHFAAALRRFRFIPRAERRACADAFHQWANARAGKDARVMRARAMFFQAIDRFICEEHEASLHLVTQARAVFADHDDRDGMALCAMLSGGIYRTFGNFDLALKVLVEAYERLTASGQFPIYLAATANSMANIHLDRGHLGDALAMFTVAHDQSTRADDFYFTIYGLHGLGRVHMLQNRRADAEEMFRRSLAMAEAHKHPLLISNSLTELATLQFTAGNLEVAEQLSEEALRIREQHKLLGGAVTNCIRLAEIRCARSQWEEAQAMLMRALAIAESLKVKPKIAQVHQMLSDVYEKTGDLAKSLSHHKRFHELREQVEREDSARALTDAKLIFEAEQTKKENVVIRAQKAEIEQKNCELQDTIDELTRAKIGRKAKAMTLGVVIVLFIFQDFILRTVLRLLASENYLLLLGVKMAIIFSLAPLNRGIENHLLKKMMQKQRLARAAASAALPEAVVPVV